MASGAITTRPPRETMEKTTAPPEEWAPPTSEPISKAFKAAEEQLAQEIIRESLQVDATFEPEDDDDDGLAEEEANLEGVSRMSDVMERATKEGILNGSIPSAAYDTAATSSCGKYGDPFIPTGRQSTKVFQTPTGHKAPASEIRLLDHDLRSPATETYDAGVDRNYAS